MQKWWLVQKIEIYLSFQVVFISSFVCKFVKSKVRNIGEFLKKISKVLIDFGEIEAPRWTVGLLQSIYLVDTELHFDNGQVFRGPVYAAYKKFFPEESLMLKMNWVANRKEFDKEWEYSGAVVFRLSGCGNPNLIDTDKNDRRNLGDIYFFFTGGYATVYLGRKSEKLFFNGDLEIPRIYSYF